MYQPHEAHVPYILQFMIDYDLYGMSHVILKNVKFRRDPEHPGMIHMSIYAGLSGRNLSVPFLKTIKHL